MYAARRAVRTWEQPQCLAVGRHSGRQALGNCGARRHQGAAVRHANGVVAARAHISIACGGTAWQHPRVRNVHSELLGKKLLLPATNSCPPAVARTAGGTDSTVGVPLSTLIL